MFKAVFHINHIGCWGSEIGLKFPSMQFSSVDVRWIKDSVAHIAKATGDSTYFDNVFNYLEGRSDVKEIEVLSKSENEIYIRTVTWSNSDHPSFSNTFFQKGCFPVAPTKFQDRFEIWTLGSAKRENLTKIYNQIKKRYEVQLKYIKEDNIKGKLTQKQREVFMYAKYFGYFEWPRKKSATEIATILKIPKTVFLSHLRKAENQILNNVDI